MFGICFVTLSNILEAAVIHFGYTIVDSPEEEIHNESEPVASLEVTAKPIADSDNPQEPTPSTPAIDPKHRKFAKGDTVVITEAGNTHRGEIGKVIFASFGSQEDEYRIALDRESHSVREVTIKIPKPCRLTYLMELLQSWGLAQDIDYADFAFAVSSPGLGKLTIPAQIRCRNPTLYYPPQ